jgi:hypothetical protein
MLKGLFESRVMAQKHIATLYFDGRSEAAKKRLQKLKAIGVIRERSRKSYEPAVYYIARQGFELLRDAGMLDDYPRLGWETLRKRAQVSDLTLRHELAVMDVKAAMVSAINATERFSVAEFTTWPLLYQFKARRPATRRESSQTVLVKPDGHIRIHETEPDGGVSEHRFFLEVDRGTETLETLALRCACYIDYYRSGGLAARHGQPRSAYRDYPFRVLITVPSEERRDNIARRLLQSHPPILSQVWLAVAGRVMLSPTGRVWTSPRGHLGGSATLDSLTTN